MGRLLTITILVFVLIGLLFSFFGKDPLAWAGVRDMRALMRRWRARVALLVFLAMVVTGGLLAFTMWLSH